MLKAGESVKERDLEAQAEARLRELLAAVPFVSLDEIISDQRLPESQHRPDLVIRLSARGKPHTLVCEVKASGQPRVIRSAILQVQHYVNLLGDKSTGVIAAPYLSPEARAICIEHQTGFLDLEGNCRLVFDGVFIERLTGAKPPAIRRALKSLFTPKSAQVLRLLLREPGRAWRMAELADAAGISLGHASNVKHALVDHEWAVGTEEGLRLTKPAALLDRWREVYKPLAGERLSFYTTLHGQALDEALKEALGNASQTGNAMLGSFSAAQWLAPYGRTGTLHLYADAESLPALHDGLKLSAATKGANVNVLLPKDTGVFSDRSEPAPGIVCASPVQTYLDLSASGERGREAADHLRSELLTWPA